MKKNTDHVNRVLYVPPQSPLPALSRSLLLWANDLHTTIFPTVVEIIIIFALDQSSALHIM